MNIPIEEVQALASIIKGNTSIINTVNSPQMMIALLTNYPEFEPLLSDEKVLWLNRYIDPYSSITTPENKEKHLLCSYTNFQNETIVRMNMLGTIAFLYQAIEEHGLKDTDCHIKEVSEEKMKEREVIKGFLDHLFKYNPDRHIKDCYEAFKDKELNDENRRFLCPEKVSKELATLPPAELFINYERYFSLYFNEIYGLTNRVFGLTSRVDFALIPYMIGTLEEIDAFEKQYGGDLRVNTKVVKMGAWTAIGPWRQNSKNVKFKVDRASNEVLDINRMMKRMDHDKFKEQMLKQKMNKIKKERPLNPEDIEALKRYHENMGTSDVVKEALSTDPTPLNADEEGLQYDVIVSDVKTKRVDVGKLKLDEYIHT